MAFHSNDELNVLESLTMMHNNVGKNNSVIYVTVHTML